MHFGKNWATCPDLSCPLLSVRTRGDTAQPSLSLPGWCYNFWWPWRRTGPGQEDRSSSSCLATSPSVLHPRSEPKSLISGLMSVNKNNIWLLLEYWTLVFFNGYFGFYCSCCTNHDWRRLWFICEFHPFRCWTKTPNKMIQVVTQALSALFVWQGRIVEDSVQQMFCWGLPDVWYLNSFWSIHPKHVTETSFPLSSLLLTTNEAFINVQL